MSMLRWDDTPRYEPGFKIGSQDENGEHLRGSSGWPYSVYRKADEIGVGDIVICYGIQCYTDAVEICARLDCLS
jgi:hypothetical protein